MERYTSHPENQPLDALAASLAAERARVALGVLECVLAGGDVSRTLPIAMAAGASKGLFEDDHEILWLVAEVAAERRLDSERLRGFARLALRHFHFWDDAQIVGNYGSSCLWSDATLDALLNAMYVSPASIRRYVGQLIAIRRREHAALEHLRHAERLLAGEVAA